MSTIFHILPKESIWKCSLFNLKISFPSRDIKLFVTFSLLSTFHRFKRSDETGTIMTLSRGQMKLQQLWYCQKVKWNWNNYDIVKRSDETGTIMMLSKGQMKLEQLWHCQKVRWNWNSYGVIKRSDETGTNLTLEQIGTNLMLIWNKLWRCQKITWNWNNYDIVNWLV